MANQTAKAGSIGSGQQQPYDSNSDPDVILFMCRQLIAELETMLPVSVHAVHPGSGSPPAAGTVDVQLLVSLIDGDGNQIKQGIVYGLPYHRIQGGPWAIIVDPAAGDIGFIISAARDITNVKASPGQQQLPGSRRKYRYSDGIYVGGCLNPVPAATIWLKPNGTWALTDQPGNVLTGDANGITATPIASGAFKVNGALHATGAVIAGFGGADQIGLQTHSHPANGSPPTPGS